METSSIKSTDIPSGASPTGKVDDGAAKLLDKLGGFSAYLHKAGVRPGAGNVLFSLKGLLDVGKISAAKVEQTAQASPDTRSYDSHRTDSAPRNDTPAPASARPRHDEAPKDDRAPRQESAPEKSAPSQAGAHKSAKPSDSHAEKASHSDSPAAKKHTSDEDGSDSKAMANVAAPSVANVDQPPVGPLIAAVVAGGAHAQNKEKAPTSTPHGETPLTTAGKKSAAPKEQGAPQPRAGLSQGNEAPLKGDGDGAKKGLTPQNHTLANRHDEHARQSPQGAGTSADIDSRRQQAQAMARTIGDDTRVKVSVNVKNEAASLKSQTSASLAPQAALAGARGQAQGAKQTTAHAAPQGKGPHLSEAPAPQQPGTTAAAAIQNALNGAFKGTSTGSPASGTSPMSAPVGAASAGAEAAQTAGLNTPTGPQSPLQQNTAARKAAAPPPPPSQHKSAAEQVSVQITKALLDGMDKIRIQLRPASMGRVDVQIELSRDGHVSAVISADNKHTLDLLKQDSRELQKALQDAGLHAGTGDLTFSLNENGTQGGNAQADAFPRTGRLRPVKEPSLEDLLGSTADHANVVTEDRVDIRA